MYHKFKWLSCFFTAVSVAYSVFVLIAALFHLQLISFSGPLYPALLYLSGGTETVGKFIEYCFFSIMILNIVWAVIDRQIVWFLLDVIGEIIYLLLTFLAAKAGEPAATYLWLVYYVYLPLTQVIVFAVAFYSAIYHSRHKSNN